MDQLTPAPVVLAARLGAPVADPPRRGEQVIETAARGKMRIAPVHVEDLLQGVGERLTSRAVHASNGGLLGGEVRHVRGLGRTQGRLSI